MNKDNVAAIILAAGQATRAGGHKLQRLLGGRAILRHVIDAFLSAGFNDLIVVTGAHDEIIRPLAAPPARVVHNDDFLSGMSSSIRCGIRSLLPAAEYVFLTPADIPLFSPQTIRHLRQSVGSHAAAIPVHDGRKGHPVLLTRRAAERCLTMTSNRVLYDTLEELKASSVLVEVDDPGILLDLDTEEDFERLQAYLDGMHGHHRP